jgi:hypothetical protein
LEPSLAVGVSGIQLRHPQHVHPATVPPTGKHSKVLRETNPGLWLEDYRLAYQAGGVDNNVFIIRNLPLHLNNSARTWLEHLSPNQIKCWEDLADIFVENF